MVNSSCIVKVKRRHNVAINFNLCSFCACLYHDYYLLYTENARDRVVSNRIPCFFPYFVGVAKIG